MTFSIQNWRDRFYSTIRLNVNFILYFRRSPWMIQPDAVRRIINLSPTLRKPECRTGKRIRCSGQICLEFELWKEVPNSIRCLWYRRNMIPMIWTPNRKAVNFTSGLCRVEWRSPELVIHKHDRLSDDTFESQRNSRVSEGSRRDQKWSCSSSML